MAPRRTAHRSIGRPHRAAGENARESLLDAAVALFAEQGIARTTVAEIAARAGVTSAMVHYYFSDRDRLLDVIAKERLLRAAIAIWSPVTESDEVEPMLCGLVQRLLQAVEDFPWLPSLWLREVVSDGGQLRPRLLKMMPFEYARHLISTVRAAQRRGELSSGIEPRLVLMSVLGLTLLPLASIGVLQEIPLSQGIKREHIGRHAEALLMNAFAKRSRRRTRAV
jgi:TetR/AcrR family transcriptional regulator